MDGDAALSASGELMLAFATRTGLQEGSGGAAARYLWTDAFALCTLLELERRTGEPRFGVLARRLLDAVHHTLGRFRADDPGERTGWLSGLDEAAGAAHPTAGGLRIGKPLPERAPGEPVDERLEWERDGQYFHYLTKWMHALDQMRRASGEARLGIWARELARVASERFVVRDAGGTARRMVWKMSVDLSRALVPSMGQHDPLDGLVTAQQLSATPGEPSLTSTLAAFETLCAGRRWATDDPLGLGGLLGDAARVAQLVAADTLEDTGLLATLLDDALQGLSVFARRSPLGQPASRRLAFRELGLSLGLHGIAIVRAALDAAPQRFADPDAIAARLAALAALAPLGTALEAFWSEPASRQAETWRAHEDINAVTLAASLVPDGFLVLR